MTRERSIVRSEILLDSPLKHQLCKELKTSKQTVMLALKYANNSPLARSIRKKAKELLENEARMIQDYE